MKTYTICGSMRFAKEMQEIALILEIEYGFNILQCTYNPENVNIDDDQKAPADKRTFTKNKSFG